MTADRAHILVILTCISKYTTKVVVSNGKYNLLLSEQKNQVSINKETLAYLVDNKIVEIENSSVTKEVYKTTNNHEKIIERLLENAKSLSLVM